MSKKLNLESEFIFRTSRSGGKGGQHVNKTETKVELVFNVSDSTLLTEAEKKLILKKLYNRINEAGELRISSSATRSQISNKKKVVERFYELLHQALTKEKKRIPTKISEAKKQEILEAKKKHGEKKEERGRKTRDFL